MPSPNAARNREIINRRARGASYADIAVAMELSIGTVQSVIAGHKHRPAPPDDITRLERGIEAQNARIERLLRIVEDQARELDTLRAQMAPAIRMAS